MKKILNILLTLTFGVVMLACSPAGTLKKPSAGEDKVPRKAKEYFLNGVFLQMEERYHEALVQFHKAQIFDTSSVTISNSLAETYLKIGEFDPALYHLGQARRLDPDNEETLRLTGECYFRLQKDEEAIATFKKLLEINPYDEQARNFLLFLYGKNNNEIGKAEIFEQLIELYGRDPLLLEKVADIYFKHEDYEKARRFYNEVISIDSTDAQIYYTLGSIEEINQQFDTAIHYFEKALSLDPAHFDAMERLTMLYRRQGNWENVIDLHQEMLQRDSTDLYSRILIAEAHFYLENYQETREMLLPVLSVENVPWGVYDLLGRIALQEEAFGDAIRYFNKIISKDTGNRYGWLFLGFAYSNMDSLEKAEKNYAEALEHLPNDATLWVYYAMSQQQLEKYEESLVSYNKALQLDPYNLNALSSLPVVYEMLGMFAQSDSLYEVAIERYPDNALLLNNYSYSLSERDLQLERALEMAQTAVAAQPDRAAYLDTIGWIYYKLGKYDEAERYIKQSIVLQPDSPVVLEHLGDVYFKLGNVELAKQYWKQSLELDSGNQTLTEKLEALK